MKIIKYIVLLNFIFTTSYIFAQTEEDNYDPANFIENQAVTQENNSEAVNNESNSTTDQKNSKLSYTIEMGSSVSTSSAFGTSMNFYTAPQINYNFTPKLQFSAGVFIINSTIPNYFTEGSSSSGSTNFTRTYLMSKVSYQATEKLRISGEILYGMNKNPYSLNNNNKSEYVINFDAEYKINDSFKIGIQLSGHNLNTPYGYSNTFAPLNSNYNSPFRVF